MSQNLAMNRFARPVLLLAAFSLAQVSLQAQAPIPRAADGKPDLSGI